MSKLAFIYPGQGSQRVGMGKELRNDFPDVFDRYLGRAEQISGLPITRYCLEGPMDDLTRTEVAQPALFALSLALTEIAIASGLRPDYMAGHSLGEYTAAVAAGALSLEAGMRLVCLRGRRMAEVQQQSPGAMAAIIGVPESLLQVLCQQASQAGLVTPANLNTPTQIVVSGERKGVERLVELAAAAGAEKAVLLPVGAGFHTPLMEPVQAAMTEYSHGLSWQNASMPIASNASGELIQQADSVREALLRQISSPVRWTACMERLLQAGCSTFLELGSGRVLTGLIRQINPEVNAGAVSDPGKLAMFQAA